MSIDYKNLDDIHLEQIDAWLGHYNNYSDSPIKNEEKVFEFFNDMIRNQIQFKDKSLKPTKKDGIKTAYDLLNSIANLAPFYKKKYEKEITIITEGITFDIQDLESRQEKNSPIGQGQVLEAMICAKYWEDLTNLKPTSLKNEGFNSFLKLLYELRDSKYTQNNHELLISRALEMKQRLEYNFDESKN